MVAGDVDLDGDNEIVTLDPAGDLVRILHPETSSVSQFSVPSEENDLIVIYTDPMGAYIGHIYEGERCGEMALYTTAGVKDFTYNNIEEWQYGDGVLVFDEDLDGYDDLFIASASSDTICSWTCPEAYPVADIHPDSRMARADMDDDGDLDIVLADHQDDKLRVFFWPPPASGTWE
jgi:hypothetical protein